MAENRNRRCVAVFDFDGTLTTTDTMFDFIMFACGRTKLWIGIILFAPIIVIMFMKIIDNNKCKQMLLSWYFKNMKYSDFKLLGENYKTRVLQRLLNNNTLDILRKHKAEGHTVSVISASIKEWVEPTCKALGVNDVLATEMEIDTAGRLSGRFSTHNCFGKEKVQRLLKCEPHREDYYLYAYGDSRGDYEMFAFADEHMNVKNNNNN